jgi:hypothetical protein
MVSFVRDKRLLDEPGHGINAIERYRWILGHRKTINFPFISFSMSLLNRGLIWCSVSCGSIGGAFFGVVHTRLQREHGNCSALSNEAASG